MSSDNTFRLHGAPPFTLAVIHGGPGAPGSVSSLARALSRTRGVIEPFQRAHSLRGQVEELRTELESHAAFPLVLIGHSWGAWLSWLFAAAYPGSVSKLILVSSPAFDPSFLGELETRRLAALAPDEKTEYLRLADALKSPSAESSRQLHRLGELARKADNVCVDDTPENRDEIISCDGDQYRQVWGEAARMRQTGELLDAASAIRCPVCVIHGFEDTTPMEGVVRPLRSLIDDLSVYEIPKAGHYPWKERYGKDRFFEVLEFEIGLQ